MTEEQKREFYKLTEGSMDFIQEAEIEMINKFISQAKQDERERIIDAMKSLLKTSEVICSEYDCSQGGFEVALEHMIEYLKTNQ